MNVEFSDAAKEDFNGFERQLQLFFKSHLEKLTEIPPRRHLKHGVPHHVENVTKQARLIYNIETDTLCIIRCFSTHKEYEKWYRSFQQ